ncbi:PREDICTED: ABC transporter G family member 22-like, partial [Rhagoletis zephyria]|uniref:ABC transporter G family member 22-like n=1 Tax=Rhagoletis zephyria TaxID=28612 RepID=UPI00081182B6
MERSFEGGGGGGAFEDGEISIAWRNLDYSVGELSSWKYQRKPILRGLTGAFRTGSLNGLLGPSGAGKTTLLNCLSGCLTSGALSGEIFLNSDRSSAAFYYIAQHVHENIFSELTVGQLLRYAFAFKNGRRVKNSVREEHISKTLEVLALGGSEEEPTSKSADSSKTKKKKDSILKRPFVLCSGGEQKRISIAQELMSLDGRFNLFLDEPTTGLDSATAYGLVACLRRLAATNGNTIIASIHTPNEETLQLFDQLYIMARGGVAIFSGSPASLSTRLKELEDSDFENSDEDSDLEMETVFTSPEAPPIEAMLKVACRGFEHEDVLQLAGPVKVQSNLAISKQITSLTRQPQGGIQQSYKLFNPCDLLTETLRLFRLTFFNARSSLLSTFLLFVFFFVMLTSIFDHHKATAKGCFSVVPVFSPNESTANSSGGQPVCQNIEQSLLTNELLSENLHFLSYTVYLIGMISLVANVSLFGKYLKVLLSEHHN